MQTLATALLASIALLAMAMPVTGAETAPATTIPVRFGMDAGAVSAQAAAGAAPDYGTFWIGPWTLSSGWGGPDGQLAALNKSGVTPAIHFYYWGDDISPSCVENGCWSSLHDAQKDRAHWELLATQLTDHLDAKMGGKPAVVFLESEFNKGGISTYEPFDGYLADMAGKIHAAYPSAVVVLGYGNWDSAKWGNFDRAAAASDMVGLQAMRGSTKDSATAYDGLYDATLAGVQKLHALFPGKPVMLTDVALSSYPEPGYATEQSENLAKFFTGIGALRDAGVTAMVYRSWKDSPSMDTANYYGEAERHWGLAWAANGTLKAAGKAWVAGVQAEREAHRNHAPTAAFTLGASQLTASADATGAADVDGDVLTYAWAWGDGATGTGRTASHAYAAAGTYTVTLTVGDGQLTATASKAVTVTKPAPTPTSSSTSTTAKPTTSSSTTTTSAAAAGFSATVTPKGNEWWVEASVAANRPVAKVEAKAGTGAWVALDKKDWGAYAKSFNVPKGTMVQFRVTATDGAVATTPAKAWLVDMAARTAGTATPAPAPASTTTTTTAPSTSFRATFAPKSVGNDWWVESGATGNQGIAKVEAKVNGGAWTVLPKTDYGTYAKSVSAPNGSSVVFRATSTAGATYSSVAYTWT